MFIWFCTVLVFLYFDAMLFVNMKRKRNWYDITFKLKVVEYAKSHPNQFAERE